MSVALSASGCRLIFWTESKPNIKLLHYFQWRKIRMLICFIPPGLTWLQPIEVTFQKKAKRVKFINRLLINIFITFVNLFRVQTNKTKLMKLTTRLLSILLSSLKAVLPKLLFADEQVKEESLDGLFWAYFCCLRWLSYGASWGNKFFGITRFFVEKVKPF